MLGRDVATARARTRIRQMVAVAMASAVLTPVFNLVTSEASVTSAVQGAFDGAFISCLVAGYLFFVRDGAARRWFRELGFWPDLFLSSAIVLALFLVGRAIGQVVVRGEPRRFLTSFADSHLAYALPYFVAVVLAVNFFLQLNRMIGANVLGYFVAGVYRRPKAEERVFLFIDLEGSTPLAERLGSA